MDYTLEQNKLKLNSFVIETYKLLSGSLLAATTGAYIGVTYFTALKPFFIGLIVLEILLLLGVMFLKNKPGLNVVLLFLFTTVSGLTLAPLLISVLHLSNGISVLFNAILLTTCAFIGLTFYALTTKNNLLGLGKFILIGLIILVVAGLINLFFQSSILHTLISAVGAFIFSVCIAFDTQRLYSGEFETPVDGALSMYLNIINLFISLLNLLKTFTGEK